MIHEHNEIEIKLEAGSVDVGAFKQYCFKRNPIHFKSILGPDTYYENDSGNVVRHRKSKQREGFHELTVKLRKSDDSTFDRVEIDLLFADVTKQKDVEAFLKATGFTEAFTLVKRADIFTFQDLDCKISVVIYDVSRGRSFNEKTAVRFIEVEAEKGSATSPDEAKEIVHAWVDDICREFKIPNQPMNDSLWEYFSGRKYQVTESVATI